ncbi:MAG: cbb3-type cytochrome c oxidase subunit I [Albidovulum sp.]|uniref:cbb3-type cytochrome c oxidase subunit I n=1 Tax=Albidovulum sp. TaxID=1872424 RepID=UPI003C924C37
MILHLGPFLISFAPLLVAALLRLRVRYLILSTASGFLAAALFHYWAAFAGSQALAGKGVDRAFHDTYYVVAQSQYDFALCLILSALGAGQWLKERVFGQADETWTRRAFWGLAAGLLGTQLPQLYLSTIGMPRRYVDYPEVFGFWNSVAATSSFVAFSALTVLVILMTVLPLWRWLRRGP